jgi:hypothetical protein
MTHRLTRAAGLIAVTALLACATIAPAAAKPISKPNRIHRSVWVPVFVVGTPYPSCSWLRYQFKRTGSPYWLARYEACIA